MTLTDLPDEGVVVIPRKVGFWVIFGGFVFLAGQIYFFAATTTSVHADIASLQRADIESRARGDDVRRRISDLENQRDRITRVEEQLKVTIEMLREIREELRKRG